MVACVSRSLSIASKRLFVLYQLEVNVMFPLYYCMGSFFEPFIELPSVKYSVRVTLLSLIDVYAAVVYSQSLRS